MLRAAFSHESIIRSFRYLKFVFAFFTKRKLSKSCWLNIGHFKKQLFAKKYKPKLYKQGKAAQNTFKQKAVERMLVRWRTGVNFINILRVRFSPIFWHQKITKPTFQLCTFWYQNFVQKTRI